MLSIRSPALSFFLQFHEIFFLIFFDLEYNVCIFVTGSYEKSVIYWK